MMFVLKNCKSHFITPSSSAISFRELKRREFGFAVGMDPSSIRCLAEFAGIQKKNKIKKKLSERNRTNVLGSLLA